MKNKKWFITYLSIFIIGLISVAGITIYIDPYFHYHKPIQSLNYTLHNQRSQNDGILKHFDYDGIITGTSMTENFKTTEADKIFNANFIKVPFAGAELKEINDAIKTGLKSNYTIKYVIRSLDKYTFYNDKDAKREDLGEYPTYLYDSNIFNDTKYILNKEILLNLDRPIIISKIKGLSGGITSFDDYSNWMQADKEKFVIENVLGSRKLFPKPNKEGDLSNEEISMIKANIKQNVTDLTNEFQDVEYNYFFPPYSIVWWGDTYSQGNLKKQIETEKIAIEEILNNSNIRLFGFDNITEISTNLNNYQDTVHYGEWINSQMLEYMKDDVGLLTLDNYEDYLKEVYEFYSTYDYNSLVEE